MILDARIDAPRDDPGPLATVVYLCQSDAAEVLRGDPSRYRDPDRAVNRQRLRAETAVKLPPLSWR